MENTRSYINLARKYRPQVLRDLIGQEVLVSTLMNAHALKRIAHAFMLTGVRGVGKTTTARIIAKALNCTGVDGLGDINFNPCGLCESCVAITDDRSMDVIEIDAASRTGVDDIREIIENSKYKPTVSRYKVFIIDEVHMLSKNAFNALLKTLEEPPEHLKFIFATTEIRKVPITVLSRCQRFDLKRVSLNDLAQHLQNICLKEGIMFERESLFLIAREAGGSVRDSLSLLDRAIVYTEGNIVLNKTMEMLGQGSKEELYELFTYIINNDAEAAFSLFHRQYTKGIELDILLSDLLEICHNVNVVKLLNKTDLLDIAEYEKIKSSEIATLTNTHTLVKLWQILIKGLQELKESNNSVLFANMILLKLLAVSSFLEVEKMLEFIKNQEKKNTPSSINKLSAEQEISQKESSSIAIEKSVSQNEIMVEGKLSAREEIFLTPINQGIDEKIKEKVKQFFPEAIFQGKES